MFVGGLVVGLGAQCGTARADERPEPAPDAEPTLDELMEELIVPEDEKSDLAWLYSDEIYEPSELSGGSVDAPALPAPGEGSPRVWDPGWRRFGTSDYVLTGASIAAAVGAAAIPTSPGRWSGLVPVDEAVRNVLSIKGYDRGIWARETSDVLVSVLMTYPLLVDSLIVAYWYRASPDVAKETALIAIEALTFTAGIQGVTSGLASRERPYVRECGTELDPTLQDCNGRKPYRSFFSGHTSQAFTGAGAICTNHIHHHLFGDPAADGIACGTALTLAASTGLLRIVGNQHYFTDVMTGAAVGLLSGFGLPWLLHYGPGHRESRPETPTWNIVPSPNGVGIGGTF